MHAAFLVYFQLHFDLIFKLTVVFATYYGQNISIHLWLRKLIMCRCSYFVFKLTQFNQIIWFVSKLQHFYTFSTEIVTLLFVSIMQIHNGYIVAFTWHSYLPNGSTVRMRPYLYCQVHKDQNSLSKDDHICTLWPTSSSFCILH